ncbi:MAG: hypothetical protein P9X24_10610 [Candidatus Hatepunaea meridiana]|nr:hypothetical protein [Candidatus Hatepunaea meridiana]
MKKNIFILIAILLLIVFAKGVFDGYRNEEKKHAGFTLKDVGFKTPESALYVPDQDIYLVSNINGSPIGRDDNGFISIVNPERKIVKLKWIDGADEAITLDAPKGMAIVGDKLYVCDIRIVRIFNRYNGEPVGEVTIPGARFLNDAAPASDSAVFVTDTQGNTLYRISQEGKVVEIYSNGDLKGPNGVIECNLGLLVLSMTDGKIFKISKEGKTEAIAISPKGILDGVVQLNDNRLAFSSWEGSCVYVLDPELHQVLTPDSTLYRITKLVANVPSPADIGYDTKRDYLIIPLFKDDKLVVMPVGK